MGKAANSVKENTEVIIVNSNKVGQKLIAKKTKRMFMFRQHNAG